MNTDKKIVAAARITLLLPSGRLPLPLWEKISELARTYNLTLYLSTAQNLRLMGIQEKDFIQIKEELAAVGADFKGPGKFPIPRICIGKEDCKMGKGDTDMLSQLIVARFKDRLNVKGKFKIAISGCVFSCSGTKLTDIGIMATAKGWDVYVGGKGGPQPQVGRRIARGVDEQEVLTIVTTLADFHHENTAKKQRMHKLLNHPEFPYPEG